MVRMITVACCLVLLGPPARSFAQVPQRTYREKSLDYFRSLGNYHTALYQLEAAIGGPLEK